MDFPKMVMTIRQRIIDRRAKLDLTQEAFAQQVGVKQSVISKWEDLSNPMTELRARVLFQIIERGLETSLTNFFSEIEGKATGVKPAGSKTVAPQHVDSVPQSVVEDSAARRIIGNALVRVGSELISDTRTDPTGQARPIPPARPAQPGRRNTRPRNR